MTDRVYIILVAMIAALAIATSAHAADAPKTYTLTADQAAVVAQWAAEKRATAQQVYTQADSIISDIQKQAAMPEPPKK